jgi:23S rRNA pseudouridine2605 synthase
MKQMRQGIYIAEGRVQVDGARIFKTRSKATEMEIILREGKNREIRRILARLGHKVLQLRRIAVGPLRLGDMPPGAYRVVSREEVKKLQSLDESASPPAGRQASRSAGKKGAGSKRATTKRATTKRATTKRASTKRSAAPRSGRGGGSSSTPAGSQRQRSFDGALSGSRQSGVVIGADPTSEEDGGKRKKPKRGSRANGKKATGRTATAKKRAAKRGSAGKGKHSAAKGKPGRGKPVKKRTAKKRRTKK